MIGETWRLAGGGDRTDALVQTIDFYEAVNPASLVNKDKPPSSICVEIWTRSVPGEFHEEWLAGE